ncbi:GlcG/HbpS family heme-binding protein [Streptomyces acidiscabies]|uniref:GlcG/HbpS family heme-binding protein n=1 Tax=Streptomyces acidiscabies TaxID=42234 RepID=UPI0038F71C76
MPHSRRGPRDEGTAVVRHRAQGDRGRAGRGAGRGGANLRGGRQPQRHHQGAAQRRRSRPLGIETARRKAYTAAVTGVPTSKFAAFAASPAMAVAPVHHVDAGLLAVPGGMPITVDDGEVIGALGVGGADAETDERLASRALEGLKDLLA